MHPMEKNIKNIWIVNKYIYDILFDENSLHAFKYTIDSIPSIVDTYDIFYA
jgi:hypothetical protein